MSIDPVNIRTAIVLQGGGALGAYEFGVLKAIYDQRPGFMPAAVAGISIGAVTAAVLGGARGEPIAALETLWRDKLTVSPKVPGFPGMPFPFMPREVEQSLAVFGNPGMYGLNPQLLMAPWASTSIYETGPLRQTLAELADLDKLNHGGIRVIVGAMDIETALIKYFDNARHNLTFEAVVASGSLPPSFPMTEVGGQWYWDGGLFTNTPLSPAINFLESCEPDNPDIHRELIVVDLFPMKAPPAPVAARRRQQDDAAPVHEPDQARQGALQQDQQDHPAHRARRRRAPNQEHTTIGSGLQGHVEAPEDRQLQGHRRRARSRPGQRQRLLPVVDRGPDRNRLRRRQALRRVLAFVELRCR